MRKTCPLCGEAAVNGKCTKCGYTLPVEAELDAMSGIYDLEPSDYPEDDESIRNALPPIEKAEEYDTLPSVEYEDFVPNEPLGAEYQSPNVSLEKDPVKLAEREENVKRFKVVSDPYSSAGNGARMPSKGEYIQNVNGQNQNGNTSQANGQFNRSAPKQFVHVFDSDKMRRTAVILSILFPFIGLFLGIMLMRSPDRDKDYGFGRVLLIIGILRIFL